MIAFYLSGNPEHDHVVEAMCEGCPVDSVLVRGFDYRPAAIAVVFGVFKRHVPVSIPRGRVFQEQRRRGLDVLVLETGYLFRGSGADDYYAAGFNGLNGRADFRNAGSPADRYEDLVARRGLVVSPWRSDGRRVLVCGQVPWDASVDHVDFRAWAEATVHELRGLTQREIVFRPHPLHRMAPIPGSTYSNSTLAEDLSDAHAVVTFNSNAGVDAAVAGVPVFAADPGSMALRVANRDLSRIAAPDRPDRTQWLRDLAYAQWTPAEMRRGDAWAHLLRAP